MWELLLRMLAPAPPPPSEPGEMETILKRLLSMIQAPESKPEPANSVREVGRRSRHFESYWTPMPEAPPTLSPTLRTQPERCFADPSRNCRATFTCQRWFRRFSRIRTRGLTWWGAGPLDLQTRRFRGSVGTLVGTSIDRCLTRL